MRYPSMRVILASLVAGFVVFCGWLVIESGLFECSSQAGHSCILLQQVTADERAEAANAPVSKNEQLQAADSVSFGADNAPARIITLGSVDPESGFKYLLELSSKGAAIRTATFSGFNDRDSPRMNPG